jgi:hypothetical protein
MYAMSRDSLWFRDPARAAGTNWALRHVVANEGVSHLLLQRKPSA